MKKLLAVFFSLVVTLTVSLTLHQGKAAAFPGCEGPHADLNVCNRSIQATTQFFRESQSVEREIYDAIDETGDTSWPGDTSWDEPFIKAMADFARLVEKNNRRINRVIIDKMGNYAAATDDVDQNVDSEARIEPDTNVFFFRPGFFVRNAPSPQEVQCRNEKLVCLDKIPDSDWYPIEAQRDCEDEFNSCLRQATE